MAERIKNSRINAYTPGSTIFAQGVVADAVYVIDEGIVKVVRAQPDGRVAFLELRARGWILGLAEVLLGRPHATAVETLTPCTICRLPADEFTALLEKAPHLSRHVRQLLSQHLHDQMVKITWFSCLSARRRLECLLSDLIMFQPCPNLAGEMRVPPTLKYWEMAQAIGVNPSYFSRLLCELEADGVLRRTKGWLVIRDPAKLASLAG